MNSEEESILENGLIFTEENMDVPQDKIVWQNKWLKVRQTDRGFTYSERLGKDSVAFILIDRSDPRSIRIGLINECKQAMHGERFITAFGGSIDRPDSLFDIVRSEVLEEAGYDVDPLHVFFLGLIHVSTQMNQMCFLYVVDVTNIQPGIRTTTSESEQQDFVVWVTPHKLYKLRDWKAIVAFDRYRLVTEGVVHLNEFN